MLVFTLSPLIKLSVLILLSSSYANSDQSEENFLQCLTNHSSTFNPISEAIYTPENPSFSSVLNSRLLNKRFVTPTTPKPEAIITAFHESHVQASVICAKNHGLQLRIRSGGHDYEGLSYTSQVPFVILDMFNLRSIEIDVADESAWVEAGATLGELYYRIAEKSNVLAFPAGVCPTVGVGGHFSGGGYGNLMRKYGLSVDNIIDALLVDANGRILDRDSMSEDLFWAIRGGGGGSFGVILAWKIKLVRVPETLTVFNVKRTLEQGATNIIHRWQFVAPKLPEDLFIRAMPHIKYGGRGGYENKTIEVSFIGLFLGKSTKLLPIMNKSFPELDLQEEDCIPMSWINSTLFWAEFRVGTPTEALLNRATTPGFFKGKSDYVNKPIKKSILEAILKRMMEFNNMFMEFNPHGGRMSEISKRATPYPHRSGNLFMILYETLWLEDKDTDHHLNATRSFYKFMAPHVSKSPREAFLNYRDLDIGFNPKDVTEMENARVYGFKYFKDNFYRLVRVKSEVDPENFFRYEQSIPPLTSIYSDV